MRSGFQAGGPEEIERVPLGRHVGYLLNEAANGIRTVTAEQLAPLELAPRLAGALETIAAEGPLTQRALGERLRIDRTTIVAMVDALEERGVIRRGPHPEDRRCHALEVTPAGEELRREARRHIQVAEDRFLAPLDGEERVQLRSLLAKLYIGTVTPGEAGDRR